MTSPEIDVTQRTAVKGTSLSFMVSVGLLSKTQKTGECYNHG